MTQRRGPRANARRAALAAGALIAFAIACNAPVPTSPHQDDALSAPLEAATNRRLTPGDTVLYYIDDLLATKLLASRLQSDSLRVSDGAKYKLTLDPVGPEVRKRVEYWLTSVLAEQRAAVGHAGDARITADPAEALRETMQVDSALRATMSHAKRNMNFTGRVIVDGQPPTVLYLKQMSPGLLKTVDAMKRADSTGVLSVITTDH